MSSATGSGGVTYFEIGQAPAFDPHVLRHDPETFGLDLANVTSALRMRRAYPAALSAVKEGGKHQPIAMPIGPDQQHRSTNRVETDATASTQVFHVLTPLVRPGIEVERRTA